MGNVLKRRMLWKVLVLVCAFICIGDKGLLAKAEDKGNALVQCRAPGISLSLYKVGTLNEKNKIVPVEELSEYADSIDWESYTAAYTIAGYVEYKKLNPVAKGKTDRQAQINFNQLDMGIYLLTADNYKDQGVWYESSPSLFSLPYVENGEAKMSISINLKDAPVKATPLKVQKVWKDDDEKSRPDSIEVNLLKDRKLYDTVKLSKDNDWSYTWEDLDPYANWKAVEKLGKDKDRYKVSNVAGEGIITITNQLQKKNTQKSNSRLPQTGLLWWPAIVLACLGILFMVLGKGFSKKKK